LKYLIIIFLTASFAVWAQDSNKPVTIANLLNALKSIDYSEESKLSYKTCRNFNFKEFSPAQGKIDSMDFYEVGYNKDGDIKEIIRHTKKHRLLNYMFKVYESQKFKILILKKLENRDFNFTSLAFFIFPQSSEYENYMIDVAPRFGKNKPPLAFSYKKFPMADLANISAIAQLNNDLYPQRELKLSNGKVVMISDFMYKSENEKSIDAEVIRFFFSIDDYPTLKLNGGTSIKQIINEEPMGEYDLAARPDMHELDQEPLWILTGYYQYKK